MKWVKCTGLNSVEGLGNGEEMQIQTANGASIWQNRNHDVDNSNSQRRGVKQCPINSVNSTPGCWNISVAELWNPRYVKNSKYVLTYCEFSCLVTNKLPSLIFYSSSNLYSPGILGFNLKKKSKSSRTLYSSFTWLLNNIWSAREV